MGVIEQIKAYYWLVAPAKNSQTRPGNLSLLQIQTVSARQGPCPGQVFSYNDRTKEPYSCSCNSWIFHGNPCFRSPSKGHGGQMHWEVDTGSWLLLYAPLRVAFILLATIMSPQSPIMPLMVTMQSFFHHWGLALASGLGLAFGFGFGLATVWERRRRTGRRRRARRMTSP